MEEVGFKKAQSNKHNPVNYINNCYNENMKFHIFELRDEEIDTERITVGRKYSATLK